jgi:hypothetical protein
MTTLSTIFLVLGIVLAFIGLFVPANAPLFNRLLIGSLGAFEAAFLASRITT